MPYPRALCIEATCLAARPKRQNTQLPPGSRGGRYEGRRYSEKEAMEQKWDDQLTYRFGLSVGLIVDGAEGRNATRHTNHACEPNYQAVEHRGRGSRLEVRIETLRMVSAGEELTFDLPCRSTPKVKTTMRATVGLLTAVARCLSQKWISLLRGAIRQKERPPFSACAAGR